MTTAEQLDLFGNAVPVLTPPSPTPSTITRRSGNHRPVDDSGYKRCKTCKQIKPATEFTRNKYAKDGLHWHCRSCAARPERVRRALSGKYQRHYGITLAEYEAMLADQGGVCAICGNPEVVERGGRSFRLAVDHDHKTGKVRGLLCTACNTSIGSSRDSVEVLQAMIAYLQRHAPAE